MTPDADPHDGFGDTRIKVGVRNVAKKE